MLQVALIWLGLTLGLIGTAEIAYRTYGALHGATDAGATSANDTLMAAVLALTGLLLAFSFGSAQSHYDQRRQLVVREANAIGTTRLREGLLAEADRAQLQPLMRDYILARQAAVADEGAPSRLAEAQRRTYALQPQIWAATGKALETPEGARIGVPLLFTTNEMFDSAEAERAAHDIRIPHRTLRVLVLLTAGCAAMIGVSLAARRRRDLLASSVLFALIALAMSLIYDLDAPSAGGIRTPHETMDRLTQDLG